MPAGAGRPSVGSRPRRLPTVAPKPSPMLASNPWPCLETARGSACSFTRVSTDYAKSPSPTGRWTARGPHYGASASWTGSAGEPSSTSTSLCPTTGCPAMTSGSRTTSPSCGWSTTS
eukprot:2848766-Pyramimonas_sp.AAC.1